MSKEYLTEQRKREVQKFLEKLVLVEEAGYGEILVKVQEKKVVYITHSIGEQLELIK